MMTLVRLTNVNVRIPIYDSHSLRLIRLPSFGLARVGTNSISHAGRVLMINALTGMNLELNEGDRVCLIGQNGAGKTTLLRLVAGIYPATTGTVHVVGKVFSLIGNVMMLNTDATGYENIHLAANIHHWPVEKVSEFVRDIEQFTELGEYLSLPTRVYSAGMQARLAFAMATVATPEILLIDEGIGAGDAQFRERARARVQDVANRAKIIMLASHEAELARTICSKGLLLNKGQMVFFGDIDEALERYEQARADAGGGRR